MSGAAAKRGDSERVDRTSSVSQDSRPRPGRETASGPPRCRARDRAPSSLRARWRARRSRCRVDPLPEAWERRADRQLEPDPGFVRRPTRHRRARRPARGRRRPGSAARPRWRGRRRQRRRAARPRRRVGLEVGVVVPEGRADVDVVERGAAAVHSESFTTRSSIRTSPWPTVVTMRRESVKGASTTVPSRSPRRSCARAGGRGRPRGVRPVLAVSLRRRTDVRQTARRHQPAAPEVAPGLAEEGSPGRRGGCSPVCEIHASGVPRNHAAPMSSPRSGRSRRSIPFHTRMSTAREPAAEPEPATDSTTLAS